MTDRHARRAELRRLVFTRAGGRCEISGCDQLATSLSHLHSVGVGGRPSADTMDNALAACWAHSRAMDGLAPTRADLEAFYEGLGVAPGPGAAYRVAEVLRERLREEQNDE